MIVAQVPVPYRAQNAFTQSRSCLIHAFKSLGLLDSVRLGGLCVCHLGVLLFCLRSVALLGLGLALLALNLGLLGGSFLLPLLALFRLLLLELVVVALNDGSGNRANVLLLGDILRLRGVLAILIQPVLIALSVLFVVYI